MKVQGNPKDHFIETSSQIAKRIKSSGKPSEHTISQSGKVNHTIFVKEVKMQE